MKKIIILLIILVVAVTGAFAQVNIATMETSFIDFSDDVSLSLPFASTIGLNWSDATVRSLPHLGVGVTVGAVTIPAEAFTPLAGSMGITIPQEITDLGMGVPLPVYTIDARIGGLFLPFDIGVKLGYLPPDALKDMSMSADYTLAGFDIRTPILKQNILLPSIALSVGYNYLDAGLEAPLDGVGMASGVDLSSMGLGVLSFPTPNARFQMQSNVLDAKLQISKSLLIITPYLGVGYAYGWSNAGGGISGTVNYDDSPITSTQISAIEDAFASAGYDAPTVSADGFVVSSATTGGSFRAFGGLSVNLFVLKLDLNAMYNVNTKSLGATANVRIAF